MNTELSDIREESNGMLSGVIGDRRLYLRDVAWGLECMLGGISHKTTAGCFFVEVDGDIVMNTGQGSVKFTESEANEFVEEYLHE